MSERGRLGVLGERIYGCLVAGAVGDALGAPVEFLSIGQIRKRYGPAGTSGYDAAYGRPGGAITDDTQMTLFTLEGLLLASTDEEQVASVRRAYLRWLVTQGVPRSQIRALPASDGDGGLVGVPGLHSQRAPGNTCMSALHQTAAGRIGTTQDPINDSKGCGGVMRAAPAGFLTASVPAAFQLGCDVAALTHGHPSGYLSAGVLAATVSQLLHGTSLPEALDAAAAELRRHPDHEETDRALTAARGLAARGRPTPEDLETLGGGWTGEEALAIAVAAALTGDDMADALLLAVNHSGDADSTGAICGNLLGARDGASALPPPWLEDLELRDLIELLAEEACRKLRST